MNAMSMLTQGLKQTHAICSEHKIAMVQAGPYHKCPQCAVEFLEEQKRNAQAEIDRTVREKHFAGAMLPERHATSGF